MKSRFSVQVRGVIRWVGTFGEDKKWEIYGMKEWIQQRIMTGLFMDY